jgi:lipopolysaccharide export system ATP-binding protein
VVSEHRLMGYAAALRPHDASVAIALAELVRHADDGGAMDRGEWISAVWNAYREEVAGSTGGRGGVTVPAEQMGQYLQEHVLRPLSEAGIASGEPEGPAWERVRLAPAAWAQTAPNREATALQLMAVARGLLAGGREAGQGAVAAAGAEGGSTLKARSLVKIYRRRKVVNQVDLDVTQGEIVGLLGPNGAGKTTTFYMIVGLIPPTEGVVLINDDDLTGVPMFRRARRGIGYLAQEPSVFRKLTVEDNILAILETVERNRGRRKQRLEELLNELSLSHLRKAKAYALSGGERRRVEITRALVSQPKFMLLDEPFAGIDPIAVHDIQQIVAELKHRTIGVIITDHNVEQTLDIVDRAYIMDDGRVRASGTPAELVWNDEVAEIYLGPTLTVRMRERYRRPVSSPARPAALPGQAPSV